MAWRRKKIQSCFSSTFAILIISGSVLEGRYIGGALFKKIIICALNFWAYI